MRGRGLVVVGGVAALAVIASVSYPEKAQAKRQPVSCVYSPLVDTRIVDDRSLMVVDREGHAALLTLTGPCLQDRDAPVQVKYNSNGDRICHPADADITAGRGVPLTCGIKSIEVMTLDEARHRLGE